VNQTPAASAHTNLLHDDGQADGAVVNVVLRAVADGRAPSTTRPAALDRRPALFNTVNVQERFLLAREGEIRQVSQWPRGARRRWVGYGDWRLEIAWSR